MRKLFSIFLLEDDEIDQENIRRSLSKNNLVNPLFVAKDGIEGLEMLEKGVVTNPFVILLDLKMPRMGGLEFLGRIRADARWKSTPVVVLTSSKEEKDLVEAYRLNVAGYVVKPLIFGEFVDVIHKIGNYWAQNEFPGK